MDYFRFLTAKLELKLMKGSKEIKTIKKQSCISGFL